MQTVTELRAAIRALELELKSATELANAEAKTAAEAFRFDYDWELNWPHPAQFRVSRTATAETIERLEAFKLQFPAYSYPPRPFDGGMTYSVLIGNDGNFYVEGSGGSVILNPSGKSRDKYSSSFDP